MRRLTSATFSFLIIVLLMTYAAAAPKFPRISAFMASPVETVQYDPLTLTFAVTNSGSENIYSQLPYSGSPYRINESIYSRGIKVYQDRYTVGVSIDGGKDGFPYRWGFRGYLSAGRTTTIQGHLSFVEPGSYVLTTALMRGDTVVDPDSAKIVAIYVEPYLPQVTQEPLTTEPSYPYYYGQNDEGADEQYQPTGQNFITSQPYVLDLGNNVRFLGDSVVVTANGNQFGVFPDSPLVILDGKQIALPAPNYLYNGYPYFGPGYITPPPFLGNIYGGTLGYPQLYGSQFNGFGYPRRYGGW